MQIIYHWESVKYYIVMVNGHLVILEGWTLTKWQRQTKVKFLTSITGQLFFLDVTSLFQMFIDTEDKQNQCLHFIMSNYIRNKTKQNQTNELIFFPFLTFSLIACS